MIHGRSRMHGISRLCMGLAEDEPEPRRLDAPQLRLATALAPALTVSRAEALLPFDLPLLPGSESLRKIVTGVVGPAPGPGPLPAAQKLGLVRCAHHPRV